MLLFILASRQQNWELHVLSLYNLSKHLFVFDMINYAQLAPVYIAKTFLLKDKDPQNMFKYGNFSVNKTLILFSTIGIDHAIEQENSCQSTGNSKGIANNQKALDERLLTLSKIGNIIDFFSKVNHQKELTMAKNQDQ